MQDGSGSYRYSFTGPHHAKTESSLNGVTQGGKSYVGRTCRIVESFLRALFARVTIDKGAKVNIIFILDFVDVGNYVERREKKLSPDGSR